MFKQLAVLCALVGVVSCAGDIKPLPPRGGLISSDNAAYLAAQQPIGANLGLPAASGYYDGPSNYENNGGWDEVPLGGVQPQVGDEFAPQQLKQGSKPNGRLSNHLRELVHSAGRSSVRAYEDARPALQNIRGNLGETMNRVRNHPKVVKGIQIAKPKIEALKQRAQPVVNRGGKLITDLANKTSQHLRQRQNNKLNQQPQLPGGLPVPTMPQGAAGFESAHGPSPPSYDDVYPAADYQSKYDNYPQQPLH